MCLILITSWLYLAIESQHNAGRCDVIYGDVIDKAARKNVSICRRAEQDGGLSRVYVSQSNLLHIVFTPAASPQQQQQRNFIIHVQGKNLRIQKLECFVLTCVLMNNISYVVESIIGK